MALRESIGDNEVTAQKLPWRYGIVELHLNRDDALMLGRSLRNMNIMIDRSVDAFAELFARFISPACAAEECEKMLGYCLRYKDTVAQALDAFASDASAPREVPSATATVRVQLARHLNVPVRPSTTDMRKKEAQASVTHLPAEELERISAWLTQNPPPLSLNDLSQALMDHAAVKNRAVKGATVRQALGKFVNTGAYPPAYVLFAISEMFRAQIDEHAQKQK